MAASLPAGPGVSRTGRRPAATRRARARPWHAWAGRLASTVRF